MVIRYKSLVIISIIHFIIIDPLVRYNLHQAGRGNDNGNVPV